MIILVSIGLGIGLAMDACAVSMTNGLNEPHMPLKKVLAVAFTYGFFQALMPLIGWAGVTFFVEIFDKLLLFVPYVSLGLLTYIGVKMIVEGSKPQQETQARTLTFGTLMVQAVATSIDALATGFSLVDIAGTEFVTALLVASIIAVVTFVISLVAVYVGKKFGDKLGSKAEILGGIVLVVIGLEIFFSGILG